MKRKDNPYLPSAFLAHKAGRHLFSSPVRSQTKAFDVGVSGGPVFPGTAGLDFADCDHWSSSIGRWLIEKIRGRRGG